MRNKLTLAYAMENNYTPLDCVRYFKPNYSKKKCHYVLWEMTCFPCCMETTIKQLNELFNKKKNGKAVKE